LGKAVKGEREAVCLLLYDGREYLENKRAVEHMNQEKLPLNE
jgi:hypothetical protein